MICKNNLKQIGLAVAAYRNDHGTFPPAFVTGQDGKPAHSLRVLILPYMNQQSLYNRYRFDEPWDGPNNSQLSGSIPVSYRCPSDAKNRDQHTSYLAVVGPDAVMSGATPVGVDAIIDGQSSTLLITESATRTVHWMSPNDLAIEEMFSDLDAGIGPHAKGVNVLLADGSVPFLPQQTTKQELLGLLTRAGGEPAIELRHHP